MLEVFKLINKNAAFPYVYFLTAFDKTRVNHMLSNYIGLSKDENYSDKYFNGEYHLPEKDYFKVVNSMARLLSDKSKAYGMNIGGAIISGYWQQIQRTTVNVLKTPRDFQTYIRHPEIALTYIPCKEYNVNYSEGIGRGFRKKVCFSELRVTK